MEYNNDVSKLSEPIKRNQFNNVWNSKAIMFNLLGYIRNMTSVYITINHILQFIECILWFTLPLQTPILVKHRTADNILPRTKCHEFTNHNDYCTSAQNSIRFYSFSNRNRLLSLVIHCDFGRKTSYSIFSKAK